MNWTEIPGYFNSDILYTKAVKNSPNNATFVEVGTWVGRSTSCMAQLIKVSGKNIKFYGVDTFDGSDEDWHREWIDMLKEQNLTVLDEFKKHMILCEVDDFVIPIQATSLEASEKFEDESLDFVFIDASHDYDNVLVDINAWYPKVKVGGYISGDDYAPCWSGVRQAVDEFFENKMVFFLNGNTEYPYSQGVWHWCHQKVGD
jgi:cephalosporin hydroxylase